ncbi:MAG: hypothetical protein WD066_17490 [Planctomycetaceae bacterium]
MLPFVLPDGREVIILLPRDLPVVLRRLFAAGGRPPARLVAKLLKKCLDERLGPVDPWQDDDDDDDEKEDDDWPKRRPLVHDLVRQVREDRARRKQQLEQARDQRRKKYPRYPRCPRCQACPCARGVPHDMVPVRLASRGECPTCGAKRVASGAPNNVGRTASPSAAEHVPARNEPSTENAAALSVGRNSIPSAAENASPPARAASFKNAPIAARGVSRDDAAPHGRIGNPSDAEHATRRIKPAADDTPSPLLQRESSVDAQRSGRTGSPSDARDPADPTPLPAARGDPAR